MFLASKSGSSSGSASSLALPSQFLPSDIFKACSALQLRDSTGFTPVSLLSVNAPDLIIIDIKFQLYTFIIDIKYHIQKYSIIRNLRQVFVFNSYKKLSISIIKYTLMGIAFVFY